MKRYAIGIKNLLNREMNKKNMIIFVKNNNKMKLIPLTQGKFTMVDDEDYEYLNQWKWGAHKGQNTWYAKRIFQKNNIRTRVYMHRLILGLTDPKIWSDHKDHNGLNNQRNNLRIATPSQNQINKQSHIGSSSQYLGVDFKRNGKYKNRWCARITPSNGKIIQLGMFYTELEAAIAYNNAAEKYHGEFANLNVI